MKEKYNYIKDRITGEYDEFIRRYRKVFIKGDYLDRIEDSKKKIFNTYIAIAAVTLLLIISYTAGKIEASGFVNMKDGYAVSIERPRRGSEQIDLEVSYLDNQKIVKRDMILNIDAPYEDDNGYADKEVEEEIYDKDMLVEELKNEIEDNPSSNTISLPTEMSDGTKIVWSRKKNTKWLIILLAAGLIMVSTYNARFSSIRNEEKKASLNIELELPGFINKCVLLLNGGLVLTDAIERISDQYVESSEDSYFYNQLNAIVSNMKQNNSPIETQLNEFAKNSGVRSFIRISGIISDNVSKGTSLVEKLENESATLWFNRKKRAEELGKLAETKLTLPLVMLLVVLITVTIAPAMMKM